MQTIIRKILKPSIKLNTLVLLEIVLLLCISLGIMFFFTRKYLVEEEKLDAKQLLEKKTQHIDNLLFTIEQATGNTYNLLVDHLDQPERIAHICRKLVESNPNIEGCAIAFERYFYPDREFFITFTRRRKYNSPELITMDKSANLPYTKQTWFTKTLRTCKPAWVDPGLNKDMNQEPVITYCLPIRDRYNECVGVIAVGLSINLFSQIILEDKPTPNSYSVLLAQDGTYIIHPIQEKLRGKNVLTDPDITKSPTALEVAKLMLKGESGETSFNLNGYDWYTFFKPFKRKNLPSESMEELNWRIATVYPKDDIFGEYNHMVFHVLVIVIIAFAVFYMLCRIIIRRQMKPLIYLTESANRIAEGHFDESIPNLERDDEVGAFYKHFQYMQKALEEENDKQEEQRATLQQHHEELQKTHRQIQEDDRVKATFLHNVTDRMIKPSDSISRSVTNICDNHQKLTIEEVDGEINNIKQQSETILELLKHKFDVVKPDGSLDTAAISDEEGKEDSHE